MIPIEVPLKFLEEFQVLGNCGGQEMIIDNINKNTV